MSQPALQAQLDVDFGNGWYGYAWDSNVDFLPSSEPDDGVNVEIDVGLGYAFTLPGNSSLSLEAVTYIYPSAGDGVDYDYDELIATFSFAEKHSIQVGYTPYVFGTEATGTYYSVGTEFLIAETYVVGADIGHYRLGRGLDINYSYAELAVEGQLESLGWWLSYIATTGVDENVFYSSTTDDRLVLGVSLDF